VLGTEEALRPRLNLWNKNELRAAPLITLCDIFNNLGAQTPEEAEWHRQRCVAATAFR
jgi:hypothetical protein